MQQNVSHSRWNFVKLMARLYAISSGFKRYLMGMCDLSVKSIKENIASPKNDQHVLKNCKAEFPILSNVSWSNFGLENKQIQTFRIQNKIMVERTWVLPHGPAHALFFPRRGRRGVSSWRKLNLFHQSNQLMYKPVFCIFLIQVNCLQLYFGFYNMRRN